MKVVVLGASGMLGTMVLRVLSADRNLDVTATVRDPGRRETLARQFPQVRVSLFDAERASVADATALLDEKTWAVNAVGIIKPYIHDDNAAEVERATRVNALFPRVLAQAAETRGARVLQIATDCVYAGTRGRYLESDLHDALDVYGKTKSLGEVHSPAVRHLRCSIIGPELKGHVSLLDWFVRQPSGGAVRGFTNHLWNGVTTLHFARVCRGIITHDAELPHVQHVVPSDVVTKARLLDQLARAYRRADITITHADAPVAVDRTLATADADRNRDIWKLAGYGEAPTIEQMLTELSRDALGGGVAAQATPASA
jgi:dTDP-4-dehydrorhamnose reductase